GLQRFLEEPSYTEVNPGEDALLICRISDKRGICSWQKDYKPVGMYRGKYEWASSRIAMTGDCSLRIRSAKLHIDDGQWRCQVTASNYNIQDSLSSQPAILAVRVAPKMPSIYYNGSRVLTDHSITLAAGSKTTIICEVRYGNPPAYIEWLLEKGQVIAWSQTNTSEVDHPRLWAARAVLEVVPTRATHRKELVCRAHHPSYPPPYYKDAYIMFDVKFIPVASIVRPDGEGLSMLEEGLSSLTLHCKGDGNPKPNVWWTKNGQRIVTDGPNLIIESVTRNDSVPPQITWIGPRLSVNANLHSQVNLECKADGNPAPSYQWYYCPKTLATNICLDGYIISSASKLQIFNVTYSQRGKYVCIARNYIGGEERIHKSKAITLNVFGPPIGIYIRTAEGWQGSTASMQATVCSDPSPTMAYWFWGRFQLDVPSEIDRYKAFKKEGIDDCYLYTLSIRDVQSSDAGDYVLRVGNDKGFSSHKISLKVHETTNVTPLIAVALVFAALLVLLVCLILRCRRKGDTDYRITKLDRYAEHLHASTACSHRSPIMHISRLQAKVDQEIEENLYSSPIALQTRHPRITLEPH
ncbi:Kin of IRRE-like protein 3, partial [Papilio machaon]